MCENVSSKVICTSPKLETTQMPINNTMDKYIVVYSYGDINKLRTIHTAIQQTVVTIDQPHKHYVE